MMRERGFDIDHATLNRWVLRYAPLLEQKARKYKRQIYGSWRMDETYIKIKGKWRYLYRAVDKHGKTVDFMVTKKRDINAAKKFLRKAKVSNGLPHRVNIDKSGANKAALDHFNKPSIFTGKRNFEFLQVNSTILLSKTIVISSGLPSTWGVSGNCILHFELSQELNS